MRIAFIFSQDLRKPSGVLEKYAAQVRIWLEYGHDVCLYVITPSGFRKKQFGGAPVEAFTPTSGNKKGIWGLFSYYRMWELLNQRVLTINPDIVYMRHMAYAPMQVRLMQAKPTVLELNTKYSREYRLTASKSWQLYNVLTEPLVFRASRGILPVTEEIAGTVARYGKPICVIPNGVDLRVAETLPTPPADVRHIVFVGTPGNPWHGVDKLAYLAQHMDDWIFDIVGFKPEQLPGLAEIPNVRVHGLLSPLDYKRILAQATVGLGTLAIHRIPMNETSSLKVREYLSAGLPVILGNHDSDFPKAVWFLLTLPNTETNVRDHIKEIMTFARSVIGKRVSHIEIQQLDYREKEKARFAFFEQVVERWPL